MMAEYRLPVQHCPICDGPGTRVSKRYPLSLDAFCPKCRWYYTSTAHSAVLRALAKRPELGA
jgi:Zn-finger nucleic acid-binding protein